MNKSYSNILSIVIYGLTLLITSMTFPNYITLDTSNYGFWIFLTSLIIFILNRTVKPIITWITLPITAVTLGLFYFFINLIILKLTDILMGAHFDIGNLFICFFISIFISILNAILDKGIKGIIN